MPRMRTLSADASWQRFSHSVLVLRISALIFARVVGFERFSMSFPSSDAHGGVQADKPVPPATYAYMFACTFTPARLAESILAIASGPFSQFLVPAALR